MKRRDPPSAPPSTSANEIIDRYDAILLDSYGVLVDSDRALPGAMTFVERLHARRKPFLVMSNDASRLPGTAAARYHRLGLPIPEGRILSSGGLIAPYFREHGLVGTRCAVLGPPDSVAFVDAAGGVVVSPSDRRLQTVVVCDDEGYPVFETMEALVTNLYARIDAGERPTLVLPNPDLVYPRAGGKFGLTAGSVAGVIERALAVRYGDDAPRFVPLGKPHRPMFQVAQRRLGLGPGKRTVMIGDQLGTDVAGAHAFGLDSALIGTGLTRLTRLPTGGPSPTWLLPDLGL